MEITKDKIFNYSKTLDTYIINFSIDFKIISNNTSSIETFIKLKITLDNYIIILKELVMFENAEKIDKKRLSLSCAICISQQVNNTIVDYFETEWENDLSKPNSYDIGNYSETNVISLIAEISKITKNIKIVIQKYNWANI